MASLPPGICHLVDASVDAVAVVDPQQRVLYYNRAYLRLVGLRVRDLKEQPAGLCHTVLSLGTCTEPEGCLASRVLASRKPLRVDEVPGKEDLRFILSAVPLVEGDQPPWAVVETYRDVTAENRMQARYKDLLEVERDRAKKLEAELDEARTQLLKVFRDEAAGICDRFAAEVAGLMGQQDVERRSTFIRLMREAHTLKGSAGSIGLEDISSLAHLAETMIVRCQQNELKFHPRISDLLLDVVDAIDEWLEAAADGVADYELLSGPRKNVEAVLSGTDPETLPPRTRERRHRAEEPTVRVSVGQFEAMKRNVRTLLQAVDLGVNPRTLTELLTDTTSMLSNLTKVPVGPVLETFRRPVRDHAQRIGVDVTVVVDGSHASADRRILDGLRGCLVHLLRNAVDHGIETPIERQAAGKPSAARLLLGATYGTDGLLEVRVGDDGRGIDPGRVRKVAVERAVLSAAEAGRMRDEDVIELIWRPGFSTASQVTETSGRGVGLDAVRGQVEALGGTIKVTSHLGAGTTFIIRVPPVPRE